MKSEILEYGGYLLDFGLVETDLKDKLILDLGAGARNFAFDSVVNGVGKVISLDLDIRPWRQLRAWTNKQLAKGGNNDAALTWQNMDRLSLGANAVQLPFVDEQFDLILSRSVVPQMLLPEDAKLAIEEIVRVLKVGGQALFYPFQMQHWQDQEIANCQQILEALQQQTNLSIAVEEIAFRETSRPGFMLKIIKLSK